MQFNSIIGQADVKQHLVEMVDNNRLSHALLFLGKEGSGALQLAIALAQYIVCDKAKRIRDGGVADAGGLSLFEEPVEQKAKSKGQKATSNGKPAIGNELPGRNRENDSCGVCPSCNKSNQLIHPDIHFTYPVIPRKPGDKPVSTDYVSEWREFIKLYPYGNVYDWLQFIGAENKQGNITAEECNDITVSYTHLTLPTILRV